MQCSTYCAVDKVNFHILRTYIVYTYCKTTVQSRFNFIKGPDHLACGFWGYLFGDLMATLQNSSLQHKITTFGGTWCKRFLLDTKCVTKTRVNCTFYLKVTLTEINGIKLR